MKISSSHRDVQRFVNEEETQKKDKYLRSAEVKRNQKYQPTHIHLAKLFKIIIELPNISKFIKKKWAVSENALSCAIHTVDV